MAVELTSHEASLTGVLVSLGTAAVAIFVDWAKSDSHLTSLERSLDQCRKSSDFLAVWVAVYQSALGVAAGTGRELAIAYAEAVLTTAIAQLEAANSRETISRMRGPIVNAIWPILDFLRIRKPRSPVVWIPQLIYYAAVGISIRVAFAGSALSLAFALAILISVVSWLICWTAERFTNSQRPVAPASSLIGRK